MTAPKLLRRHEITVVVYTHEPDPLLAEKLAIASVHPLKPSDVNPEVIVDIDDVPEDERGATVYGGDRRTVAEILAGKDPTK